MRKSLLTKLCCPVDKNDLEHQAFQENEAGDIIEGLLTCPKCHRYYPIIYGLPIMTPDEYREKSLEAPILEKWGLTLDQARPDVFALANGAKNSLKQSEEAKDRKI